MCNFERHCRGENNVDSKVGVVLIYDIVYKG